MHIVTEDEYQAAIAITKRDLKECWKYYGAEEYRRILSQKEYDDVLEWLFGLWDRDKHWTYHLIAEGYLRKVIEWNNVKAPNQRKWRMLRRAAMERDDYKCADCGTNKILCVHHIIPKLNKLDNLITLCGECHAKRHHGQTSARLIAGQTKRRG